MGAFVPPWLGFYLQLQGLVLSPAGWALLAPSAGWSLVSAAQGRGRAWTLLWDGDVQLLRSHLVSCCL